jgi:hypothetical protein
MDCNFNIYVYLWVKDENRLLDSRFPIPGSSPLNKAMGDRR